MANEAETRRWNDDRWAAAWPERERLTNSVTPFLLEVIGPVAGRRVLDIGCGGGWLTVALAHAVGSEGSVTGVDISTTLLALAGTRVVGARLGNVDLVRLDMQSDPVDAAAFDLAVSQFGVMFFDEPDRAFANVRSHLRPGGRLVFAAWQAVERNPWHTGTALAGLVAAPPAPGPGKRATGPFTLGDTGYTERLLAGAGFVDISWKLVDTSVDAPASAVVDRSLFDLMGVPAERMGEAGAAIDRHLAPFEVGPDVYRFPLAFHIFSARNL